MKSKLQQKRLPRIEQGRFNVVGKRKGKKKVASLAEELPPAPTHIHGTQSTRVKRPRRRIVLRS